MDNNNKHITVKFKNSIFTNTNCCIGLSVHWEKAKIYDLTDYAIAKLSFTYTGMRVRLME